jgi:hypothetical protein
MANIRVDDERGEGWTIKFTLSGAHITNLVLGHAWIAEGGAQAICREIGAAVLKHCRANECRPPELYLRFEDPLQKRSSNAFMHHLRQCVIYLWDPELFDKVKIVCPICLARAREQLKEARHQWQQQKDRTAYAYWRKEAEEAALKAAEEAVSKAALAVCTLKRSSASRNGTAIVAREVRGLRNTIFLVTNRRLCNCKPSKPRHASLPLPIA